MARAVGSRADEALGLGVLGWDLALVGRVDEGVAAVQAGVAIADELGGAEGIALGASNLATLLDRVGRPADALEVATQGWERVRSLGVERTYGGLDPRHRRQGGHRPRSLGPGGRPPPTRAAAAPDRHGRHPAADPAWPAGHVPRRPRVGRELARRGTERGRRRRRHRGSRRAARRGGGAGCGGGSGERRPGRGRRGFPHRRRRDARPGSRDPGGHGPAPRSGPRRRRPRAPGCRCRGGGPRPDRRDRRPGRTDRDAAPGPARHRGCRVGAHPRPGDGRALPRRGRPLRDARRHLRLGGSRRRVRGDRSAVSRCLRPVSRGRGRAS